MINGTYQIEMKSPMGKKHGRLTLQEIESSLSGNIDILGHANEIHGDILSDGSCQFSGVFITRMRHISFRAEGCVDEFRAEFLIYTDDYTMPLFGEIDNTKIKGG